MYYHIPYLLVLSCLVFVYILYTIIHPLALTLMHKVQSFYNILYLFPIILYLPPLHRHILLYYTLLSASLHSTTTDIITLYTL
jgi:hypothetical protein